MGRGPTKEFHKKHSPYHMTGTLTCLLPHIIKKRLNNDFPLVMYIEPTNACNLQCTTCPRELAIETGKRKLGFMDWEMYISIIEEIKKYKKLIMLTFHKDGESLLHPRIYDMIRYAKNENAAEILHFNTNGLCLNSINSIRKLILSGLDDVTFSIDAAFPETYNRIKGKNQLSAIEKNIRLFFIERKKLGLKKPFARVKIMESDDITIEEINAFINKWEEISDEVQVTGTHNWGGGVSIKSTDETVPIRFPCTLLWCTLAINWDGYVSPCPIDWDLSACVGKYPEQTIHEIWKGEKIKKLRKQDLFNEHPNSIVCKTCPVWGSGTNLTNYFMEKKDFYDC